MDIRMPGMDGLAASQAITELPELADVRIIVLTTFEVDEYVLAALRSGASGFLGKSVEPEELLDAIRIVAGGDALLSPPPPPGPTRRFPARPRAAHPDRGPTPWPVLPARSPGS